MEIQFPSKEEFLKDIKKCKGVKEDELDVKREFYDGWVSSSRVWNVISDYTSQSLSDDEMDYINDLSNDELYAEMLKDAKEYFLQKIKDSIPIKELMKYATEELKLRLKEVEKYELIEDI
jgi:hypothetical protein